MVSNDQGWKKTYTVTIKFNVLPENQNICYTNSSHQVNHRNRGRRRANRRRRSPDELLAALKETEHQEGIILSSLQMSSL